MQTRADLEVRPAGSRRGSVWAVVVNWRRPDITEECVRLLRSHGMPNLKILVVDNESDQEFAKRPGAVSSEALVLEIPVNLGYAGGVVAGMEQALANGADAILAINNDCMVRPHFLEPLLDELANHPDTGSVGPLLCDVSDSTLNWINAGQHFDFSRASVDFDGYTGFAYPEAAERREVGFLCGACVVYRREALEDVGLLDPRLFLYAEETDWTSRARKAGWKAVVIPRSRVDHKEKTTTSSVSSARAYFIARNQCWIVRRHGTRGDALVNALRTLGWRMPKAAAGHLSREDAGAAMASIRGSVAGVLSDCSPAQRAADAAYERRYELAPGD